MLRVLALILLVGWFHGQNVMAETTNEITLATAAWEPYISETEPGHGKFSEIVTAVFKEMGIKIEYIFAPWKRVETMVKNGEVFAGLPYSYTEERHQIFDYSVPVMNSSNVFFYNKKNYPNGIDYSKIEELSLYRISGVTGYWYEILFAQAKLNIDYVKSDEQSITKLYFNRVDLAATDELVGWALIKKLYPNEVSQFAVVTKPFKTTSLHLLISRKYPKAAELTEKFNAAFKNLAAKGVLPL